MVPSICLFGFDFAGVMATHCRRLGNWEAGGPGWKEAGGLCVREGGGGGGELGGGGRLGLGGGKVEGGAIAW